MSLVAFHSGGWLLNCLIRLSTLGSLLLATGVGGLTGQARDSEDVLRPLLSTTSGIYHSRSVTLPEMISPEVVTDVFPTMVHFSYNPFAPFGGNDGAAWQGRGFNTWSTLGGRATWGPLSMTLEPEISWAENLDFVIMKSATSNPWGDYGTGLDRLQRFGDKPVFHWDWGNSEIRLRWGLATLGFGTEAVWLGGAERNSIVLSDNAGGFPHLDLGTLRPWRTEWGTFEARFLWGALFSSDDYLEKKWSLDSSTNFIHALVASYSPPFLENLTLGYTRAFVSPWTTRTWWKAFQSINDSFLKWTRIYDPANGTVGVEDDIDQLISFYANLDFPSVGFSLHFEFARNDHSGDWRDVIRMPFHAGAYVVGASHEVPILGQWSGYYQFELANLLAYEPGRKIASWYRHRASGGYTNGGQVLGATIGPGSSSQYGTIGLKHKDAWVGLEVERIENDTDYQIRLGRSHYHNNVTTRFGLQGGAHWAEWGVFGSISKLEEINRQWVLLNDFSGVALCVSVSFKP